MKIEYKKDFHKSYLVLHMEQWKNENSYPWKMVTENNIPSLLNCICRKVDREILLYYDISSRISLEQVLSRGEIQGKEIVNLLRNIMKVLHNTEEYLLPEEGVCLEARFIYMDAHGENMEFCYIPESNTEIKTSLRKLLEEILPVLDHRDKTSTMIIYEFYQNIINDQIQSENLEKLLYKQEGTETIVKLEEKTETDINDEIQRMEFVTNEDYEALERKDRDELLDRFFDDTDEEKNRKSEKITVISVVGILIYIISGWYIIKTFPGFTWGWAGSGLAVFIGMLIIYILRLKKNKGAEETKIQEQKEIDKVKENNWKEIKSLRTPEIMWEEREYKQTLQSDTCILDNRKEKEYCLKGRGSNNQQVIILKKKPFLFVGYMEEKTDICIPFKTVSRIHARLRNQGNQWFISDLNSKNGTWVNGQELKGDEEICLQEGDSILFADLEYSFQRNM